MRKLLGTLTLLLVVIGLVGFWRGWFTMSTNSEAEKTKIEVTIDRDAVKADTAKLRSGARDLSQKIADGLEDTDTASDQGSDDQILPPQQ